MNSSRSQEQDTICSHNTPTFHSSVSAEIDAVGSRSQKQASKHFTWRSTRDRIGAHAPSDAELSTPHLPSASRALHSATRELNATMARAGSQSGACKPGRGTPSPQDEF